MKQQTDMTLFPHTQRLNLMPRLFVYYEVALDISKQRNFRNQKIKIFPSENQDEYRYPREEEFIKDMLTDIGNRQLCTRNSVATKLARPIENTLCHLVHSIDINNWLERRGDIYKWVPTSVTVAEVKKQTSAISNNWRHLVQKAAYEHWILLKANGANPSVHSICDDMARWCVDNDIKGGKGQHPRAGTLRNVVLGAGNWIQPHHSKKQAEEYLARIAQIKVAQIAR